MARNREEIRQVAESLIQTSGQQVQSPVVDLSHSHSINTIPSLHDYIISENLLAGQRFNGRMSSVRRFFCLFVTFDLLFTGLMWLICVMLNGQNIMKALSLQIVHYNIHTSLFDVVLVALCRFASLLLFYGLFYINHWIIIGLSTALTSLFLISKVFVYDWPHSSQPVFEVLLVLVSFVLCWGEAWFFDFRVLPQESNANRYLTTRDSERAPLIQQYVNDLPSMYTESVANYYSPIASPGGSVRAFQPDPVASPYKSVFLTRQEENDYKTQATQILQEAWDLLHKNNWVFEKQQGLDSIHTLNIPKIGKIYKLSAYIELPPRYLLEELFYRVDQIPLWNPALLESHKIHTLDEHTDICYQISADGAAGLVSSRDFVTLRHWQHIEGCYIIACKGTDYPTVPETKQYVRGQNGTGCWSMQPDPMDETKCYFHWVLNINLNMKLLMQAMKDTAVYGMMFDYAKHLRRLSDKLNDKQK